MSLDQKLELSGKTLAGPRKLKRIRAGTVIASLSREVRWKLPSRKGSKGSGEVGGRDTGPGSS